MEHPVVKMHLLPGGIMPKRQTKGAVGYDVHLRAIVSPHGEMDPETPHLRRTLFDFETVPDDPETRNHIVGGVTEGGAEAFSYVLDPGQSVLGSIGFITEMPFPMYYRIEERGGWASKNGVEITNALTIVDSDYRGEAGILIRNRNDHEFLLRHGMRMAQITFHWGLTPRIKVVGRYNDLSKTKRGVGSFGSTGLR